MKRRHGHGGSISDVSGGDGVAAAAASSGSISENSQRNMASAARKHQAAHGTWHQNQRSNVTAALRQYHQRVNKAACSMAQRRNSNQASAQSA